MNENTETCAMKCWGAAAVFGLLVLVLNLSSSMASAVLLGLLVFGFLGLLFNWLFCAPVPKAGQASSHMSSATSAAATIGAAAAVAASTASAASKPAAASAPETKAAPKAETTGAAQPEAEAAPKPDTPVEDSAPAPEKDAAPKSEASASAESGTLVKPSKQLAGQAELAERKGSWKYEGGSTKAKTAGDPPASGVDQDNVDRDGDGVVEGTNEGSKPQMLDGPRDGGADNLKEIKGIGPKLETVCNSLGVYHFDQIAAWTADELAWVDSNLVGFKGRATRDDWVGQAKILAAGGETEFSQRVEEGKVY